MCLNHLHDLVISLLTQRSDSQNEERTFHFEKKKKKRNESPIKLENTTRSLCLWSDVLVTSPPIVRLEKMTKLCFYKLTQEHYCM